MAGGAIPPNLAPLFQAAGKQYGIPPAVLAGVASVESNLGQNTGPSSAGAVGLMQFEPSTAKSLGVNPFDARSAIFGAAKLLTQYGYHQNAARALGAYNGGPGNPQYSYARQVISEAKRLGGQLGGSQAAVALPGSSQGPSQQGGQFNISTQVPTFDQAGYQKANARYIAGSFLAGEHNPFDVGPKGADTGPNPLFSAGALTTTAPNAADFQGTKTLHLTLATGALQRMAGTSLVNVHPNARGYVNPIPGAVIGRTDMGVDANLKPGAPIRAIGDSRVVGISPNWYRGQPYVLLQLLSGPQKGKFYYVAEQIAPSVKPGQTVRAGQPIGRYAQSGTGLELGWGSPTPGRTLAQATTGYSEGQQTQAGSSFRNFLGSL